VRLAPGRASRPPDTLVTCPYEEFADPGRAHIGCDGELQLCQGVSAGNVLFAEDGGPRPGGLAAVLDAFDPERVPVVRELQAGGPWALAQRYDLTPQRELYADECDLCYELRSALRRRFPRVLAPAQCYGELAADEEPGGQESEPDSGGGPG
jgi:hypothetical protein